MQKASIKEAFFYTIQLSSMQKKAGLSTLARTIGYLRAHRTLAFCSVIVTITFALLVPVRPYVTQYMFDHAVVKSDAVAIKHYTPLLLILLLFEGLFQFLDGFLANLLGQHIVNDLRNDVFKKNLSFHVGYFDKTPVGTIVTRVVSDIETIGDVFSDGLIVISGDILKLLIIFGVMLHTNWQLTLICLTTIPVLIGITIWFKNAIKKTFQDVRQQVAKLNGFVQERLSGMQIVQVFNREDQEFEKFKLINSKHRDANIISIWYYSVFFPIVELLSSVSLGLLVWYGGLCAYGHSLTLGEIISFVMYIGMLFRPIRMLADRFNTIQMGMVSSERVFNLLDAPELVKSTGNLSAEFFKPPVIFKNVSFRYDNEHPENWALRNVTLEINPGKMVALVGETGSGKTSVVNLLNRFYEFQEGQILINGHDLRNFEMTSIRNKIALVMQDVFLFSDTIANNVAMFDPLVTRQAIISAAKEIGVHDFIMTLPGNYDYSIKERGSDLSLGQRQLIAFIRASVFNPELLILDEATSSVDSETEQYIKTATSKLAKTRTSIVIAHRLATIQMADKLYVFEKGQIIEQGNHQSLYHLKGKYYELCELQNRKSQGT